jgi:hypothetical protein
MTDLARKWTLAAGVLLLSVTLLGTGIRANDNDEDLGGGPELAAPGSRPFGISHSQWSGIAWIALLETPVWDYSPCAVARYRNVLFLRASGGGDPVSFACTVRPGTALFFPILTTAWWCGPNFEGCPFGSVEALRADVARVVDEANPDTDFVVELDRRRVDNLGAYRFASPLASADCNPNSPFGIACATGAAILVADGYWAMVNPMTPGTHVIHYRADLARLGYPLFDTTVHVTVSAR